MTVHCPAYNCKLTEAACAQRYRAAQKLSNELVQSRCRSCEDGRERAGLDRRGKERPTQYAVVWRNGAHMRIRCACGAERALLVSTWESARRPQRCQKCHGKDGNSRGWAHPLAVKGAAA